MRLEELDLVAAPIMGLQLWKQLFSRLLLQIKIVWWQLTTRVSDLLFMFPKREKAVELPLVCWVALEFKVCRNSRQPNSSRLPCLTGQVHFPLPIFHHWAMLNSNQPSNSNTRLTSTAICIPACWPLQQPQPQAPYLQTTLLETRNPKWLHCSKVSYQQWMPSQWQLSKQMWLNIRKLTMLTIKEISSDKAAIVSTGLKESHWQPN